MRAQQLQLSAAIPPGRPAVPVNPEMISGSLSTLLFPGHEPAQEQADE
ncbi:MAG: hypothetical protein JW902_18915 [Syntrophaceae bacterium]|nr:hypothetical protein [Syntrophaceae bacterium]